VKIRLMGSEQECTALAALLQTTPGLHVADISRPYPNRDDPAKVRIYIDVFLSGTIRADAAVHTTTDVTVRRRNLPGHGDASA
jgi:hypothetical protein